MKLNLAEIYIFRYHQWFSKITVFGSSYQVNPSRKTYTKCCVGPTRDHKVAASSRELDPNKINNQTDPMGSSAPSQVEQQESIIKKPINHQPL